MVSLHKGSGRLKLQMKRLPAALFCHPETVTITPKDARWVGAWWMGFMVSSALLLVSSVPFWFLPRSLPKQGGDEGRRENLDGTENALNNNHKIKLTDIAKG